MDESNQRLTMKLLSPDPEAEDLPELAKYLRQELLDLNEAVLDADFAPTDILEGSKTGSGLDWNTLLVTLIASGGVATTAIGAVVTLTQVWLKRHEGRNITIEFSNGSKLTAANLTPEEQKRLTEALLNDLRGFSPHSS
jgi:hypothetical protein